MLELIIIGLGATLLYLSNQNQQILAKPISFPVAIGAIIVACGYGLIGLSQQYQLMVALLQCIAMISLVFMVLPMLSGFYNSSV